MVYVYGILHNSTRYVTFMVMRLDKMSQTVQCCDNDHKRGAALRSISPFNTGQNEQLQFLGFRQHPLH